MILLSRFVSEIHCHNAHYWAL